MDTTLLIAALSLALAAMSVGWQIASWLMDGRRVRVSLLHGLVTAGGAYVGRVERDGAPRDLAPLYTQGLTGTEVVGVAVTNVGRAPVRVDGYSFELVRGGMSVSRVRETIGPQLPYRLPAGETETWYAPMAEPRALVEAVRAIGRQASDDVRAVVDLGTGDKRRTRRTVAVHGRS